MGLSAQKYLQGKDCGQGRANVWNAVREVGSCIFDISGIKEDPYIQAEL